MPRSVLVVDDDRDLRFLIGLNFEHEGWEVLEAWTAETAVELARQHRPDLIVLDDHLGNGRRGSEAARELKTCSPSSHIILYTAGTIAVLDLTGIGVDEVLSKCEPVAELVRRAATLAAA